MARVPVGVGRNIKSATARNMSIPLKEKDRRLVEKAKNAIKVAYESAEEPPAVAKSITSYAVKYRNRGRNVAKGRYSFRGICEASGKPLERQDAHLDELEPKKGYGGKVRWVCPKANNSGKRSCGGC